MVDDASDASDDSDSGDENDDTAEEEEQKRQGGERKGSERLKPTSKNEVSSERSLERTASGNINIKDMLDRWNEPVNNEAKVSQ